MLSVHMPSAGNLSAFRLFTFPCMRNQRKIPLYARASICMRDRKATGCAIEAAHSNEGSTLMRAAQKCGQRTSKGSTQTRAAHRRGQRTGEGSAQARAAHSREHLQDAALGLQGE